MDNEFNALRAWEMGLRNLVAANMTQQQVRETSNSLLVAMRTSYQSTMDTLDVLASSIQDVRADLKVRARVGCVQFAAMRLMLGASWRAQG